MILGAKKVFYRHLLVGAIALVLVGLFWYSHFENTGAQTALWKSLADTAFVFLFITLSIGPLTMFWKPALKILTWRREFGIWFAVIALFHATLISILLFNWNVLQTIPTEMGLANLLGFTALFWALVLAATSSDRAVKYLGIGSWKWLHYFAYVIFYLVGFHMIYYLFINPISISWWYRYVFLIMVIAIPVLQISAFLKMVLSQHKRAEAKPKGKNIFASIKSHEQIAKGTYRVDFDISKENFQFEAGQHTGVWLPKLNYEDPRGNFRIFSINTSPNNKKTLSVAFRETGSGFKKTLLEFPEKTKVELMAAEGYFVLPKDKNQKVALVAGGIGITPAISILRFAAEEKLPNKIILHYVNSGKETTAYLDEIKELAKTNKNLTLKNYFSREEFAKGVEEMKSKEEYLWYISGPARMVADIKDSLSGKIRLDKIVTEEFTGY